MKRYMFKCTLLSDVVISAKTATEGGHECLDFIPGSNMLGILAAATYNDDLEKSYTLFHSGKVRFGDAHIAYEEIRSQQVPFLWYYPKGEKLTTGENYMLNFMNKENFIKLEKKGIQLKQARDGYFIVGSPEGQYFPFVKFYSQKTAYDSDHRRSAESEMFGYEALPEGSKWLFYVDVDDDIDINESDFIKLSGHKRLARSKGEEFGQVKIDYISSPPIEVAKIEPQEFELEDKIITKGKASYINNKRKLVFLYADSRLVFHDRYGQPCFTPTPEQLGLPEEAEILWDRSQIRTGMYAPWNKQRSSHDEDRVFIEKGSVFVIDFENVDPNCTDELILKGVGHYRNEGFGQILINPSFLNYEQKSGKLTLRLVANNENWDECDNSIEKIEQDNLFIQWMEQNDDPIIKIKILEHVSEFVAEHYNIFKKVSNSQWGEIRSFAKSSKNKDELILNLFGSTDTEGYLTHGVGMTQWTEGKETLKSKLASLDDKLILGFTEKLASKMQKHKGGEQ